MNDKVKVGVWQGVKIGFGFALGFPAGVFVWGLLLCGVLRALGVPPEQLDLERFLRR